MTQQATIYRILIASPSDVAEEREIAKHVIYQWNADNAMESGIVLLPVMWETDVLPGMGQEPQSIINEQIVADCDLAIALFWTRIGSKTNNARSGTVEEIRQVLANKKQVLIGFSQAPCPPSYFDAEQMTALREYQTECEQNGIIFTFSTHDDFRYILSSHLAKLTSSLTQTPENQTFSYKTREETSRYNVQKDSERLTIQAQVNHEADMFVLDKIIADLNQHRSTLRILDVGCGYGHVTQMRFGTQPHCQVTAIDCAEAAIAAAQAMNTSPHIHYQVMDYTALDATMGSFDIVFCAQFLQHTGQPEATLRKLWQQVKPHGYLVARNSDDGADILYPYNDELEQLITMTDQVRGSSDRAYGRKLYTQLTRLTPAPTKTDMHFNVLSTAGLNPTERKAYFKENHAFRLNYARNLAERSDASAADRQLLQTFERIYALNEERYATQADNFEAAVQFIGYAKKPAA